MKVSFAQEVNVSISDADGRWNAFSSREQTYTKKGTTRSLNEAQAPTEILGDREILLGYSKDKIEVKA